MQHTVSNRHKVIAIERGTLNFSNLLQSGNKRIEIRIENTIGSKKACSISRM
jgi:hypothetical protein